MDSASGFAEYMLHESVVSKYELYEITCTGAIMVRNRSNLLFENSQF